MELEINAIETHYVMISKNKSDVAEGFAAFCGIQTIYENLGLTFSRKFINCSLKLNIKRPEDVIYENGCPNETGLRNP